MKLTENDKNMISAINLNNIEEIYKNFSKHNFNINIFEKNNVYLFDKNAKYLSYFRGCYYYYNNYIKAKKLMKYNNPFMFLLNRLGHIYYCLKKYNKAIYCLKRKKYNNGIQKRSYYYLYNIYNITNNKIKSIYYLLKYKCLYSKSKIYYIFFILNKK